MVRLQPTGRNIRAMPFDGDDADSRRDIVRGWLLVQLGLAAAAWAAIAGLISFAA